MLLTFPKVLSLNGIENIIAEFKSVDNTNLIIDFSQIDYVNSGTANYLLLIPFLFKERIGEIKINNKKDSYKFLKKVGVVQELENNFKLVDSGKEKVEKLTFEEIVKTNQAKVFDMLSSSPFLRTFLASNDKNRSILKILSKEYKSILKSSSLNEYKVSTCLIELIDNVFQHSEKSEGAISIHFAENNKIPFLFIVVTDLGIGFKNSLLKSKNYYQANINKDSFFIEEAINVKVSSTDSISRGFGLPSVVKSCDRISISSGFGNVTVFNDSQKKHNRVRENKFYIQGANIVCIVRLDDNKIIQRKKDYR